MNKTKFMIIVLIIMIGSVGCRDKEQSGDILEHKSSAITSKTINLTMMQPETINPITNKNKSVGYIMNLVYDGLFTINQNYDIVPQLVKEYNILIELDGRQHYDKSSKYYNEVCVCNDKIKDNFAAKNCFKLIRVKSDSFENFIKTFDEVLL